jgi:hypothetical protein
VQIRQSINRFLAGTALAVAAILGTSGVVLADDVETGQHGHYSWHESDAGKEAVRCIYAQNGNVYTLRKILVRAPYLWWPDTSTTTNQHGRVAYRTWLRVDLDSSNGPWSQIKKSPLHYGTAYEDSPAYDLADEASLEMHEWAFTASDYSGYPNAYVTVRIKALWYTPGGSVLGTVTRDISYYKPRYGPTNWGLAVDACKIRFVMFL